MSALPPPFLRDRSTWALYLLLGFYAFVISTFGAFMPFLRLELDLSYTQASQHSSLFALGLLLSSLSADRLAHQLGAARLLWGGTFGMALGLTLVLLAPSSLWSLSGFFLIGVLGALALIQISAVLSAKHGPNRTRAISEANVLASFCAVLAPLTIGAAEGLELGWRAGVGLAPVYLALLALLFGRTHFPARAAREPSASFRSEPLPGRYWRHWATILLCVGAEFGVMFWAVDFLGVGGRFTPAGASLALSGFLGTMLLGRILGTRLAARLEPKEVVLTSLIVALVGFVAYWLGSAPWLQLVGILVTGLGVANLYPFNVALALGSVSGDAMSASARISLGSGSAILLSPIILGAVADRTSLQAAQGLLPLLLLLALLNLFWLPRRAPEPQREKSAG